MKARHPEFDRLVEEHDWDIDSRLTWSGGVWVASETDRAISYPESGHASLRAAEDRSFWFRSRAEAIVDAYRRFGDGGCVWEVGAGNGHVAAALVASGVPAVAVEPGAVGAAHAAERGLPTVRAVLAEIGLPTAALSAIGMFDVLEHVENPQPLLAEVHRVLQPGGLFLVTVPAYQWLWSDKDLAAGHFRRYNRTSLENDLEGFEQLDTRYLFPLLVLPMAIRYRVPFALRGERLDVGDRVASDLATGDGLVASFVDAVFAAEGRLTRALPIPFGTSLLAVYRKP